MSDFKNELYINQFIPKTIQGEGDLVGITSTIVRLSNCNLRCTFCDSKHSWIHPVENLVVSDKNINEFIKKINDLETDNLMITGGEPLLYQDNGLFFQILDDVNKSIEIETNGTLLSPELQRVFNNYEFKYGGVKLNISPKLNLKYYHLAQDYTNLVKYMSSIELDDYIIKFVYGKKSEQEIFDFIKECKLKSDNVFLMPYTPDMGMYKHWEDFHTDFMSSCKDTVKACIENNFRYSPRLQVDIFGHDKEEKL